MQFSLKRNDGVFPGETRSSGTQFYSWNRSDNLLPWKFFIWKSRIKEAKIMCGQRVKGKLAYLRKRKKKFLSAPAQVYDAV